MIRAAQSPNQEKAQCNFAWLDACGYVFGGIAIAAGLAILVLSAVQSCEPQTPSPARNIEAQQ